MSCASVRMVRMSAGWLLAVLVALTGHGRAAEVERWGVREISLDGPGGGNPYVDVRWSATFSQGERRITVPGFWDGGNRYKVRFSPPTAGEWRYETRSTTPELNGKSGAFTTAAPAGNNHGPVEVFATHYLRYADGTPYHQFGTTCYAWVHQPLELQEQTLKTLAAAPFNKIRFCVFPKSYYVANKNEPELFAFQKGADGKFDFSRPDPAFWRLFERRLIDLQKLGIEADIILWHPYDRWGFSEMSDEQDDHYLRYCIARLSAYRNVWWSLANEYDFMTNRPGGHRGNKQWEDWDRFFQILQKEDPHQRLRSIHNGGKWYDHTQAWVTHASIQSSDMKGGVRYREKFGKPVVYDECRYEGNISSSWGNLTAREMVQRFWLGTLRGCYVGHGETYQHPQDILWWSKGGVLHGQSPQRIAWLKTLMSDAPPFHELRPAGDDKGRFLLAKPAAYYLLYCVDRGAQTVALAGDRPYKLDLIDPWEMTVAPVGTASAGECSIAAPKPDMAYRFTPYAPGEKLRPEAKITASATEGTPPLEVRFAASGDGEGRRVHWDFGDDSSSDQPNPTHVFQKPGLFSVVLTVTDADGGIAKAFSQVAVDRKSDEPIVRAGFAEGESPALKLNGTARRGAGGALHLPDGQPWGCAQAGEGVQDDLRGLRSFTIAGWLKPESLRVGAGGNRILFCLNRDRAGIDLVCLADGRLRLAVNQWPDGVRNDSSAGKLQVGKWTYFAVTYDATKAEENVGWYFAAPSEEPIAAAGPMLDRRNTYAAGPVGSDIGPLAIGNFNETMRGHGLDRQFRGEIRALRVFGSRVGTRGALTPQAIQGLVQAAAVAPQHDANAVAPRATLGPTPATALAAPGVATPKPRIVVLTDISPDNVEPDDMESLIRLLVHADLFEIEGLVATTGWSNGGGQERVDLIHAAIDAYEKDLPNLRKVNAQAGHAADESRQAVGYWPSPQYLRARTVLGSRKRGMAFVGKDNDSPGSELIIKLADEDDRRPLWVLAWGGGNTLAQAVWRVKQDRTEPEFKAVLRKLRFYAITDQDRDFRNGTPYDVSAHQWLRREFAKDLRFLWDECAWTFQNGTGKRNWADYEAHVQNHGNLGRMYPKYRYGVEGDTPSFMYVWPNGLSDPEEPGHVGWGGYFAWATCADGKTEAFTNHKQTPAHAVSRKYSERFYAATFNSFAARMDWAKYGAGNRDPVVVVNGDRSLAVIKAVAAAGETVTLDASASSDPDGDRLKFSWWTLPEAGTYAGAVAIAGADTSRASAKVPADAAGKRIHVICEVTDDGTHNLTRYRRIVIESAAAAPAAAVTPANAIQATATGPSPSTKPAFRPRVIVLSDFPPLDVIPGGAGGGPPEKRSDPDDVQSMVRFLLYANEFDVEGLVASAGTFANIARKRNILDILDLYDRVDENLRKVDPRFPAADKLRAVTFQGRDGTWGKPVEQVIGEGKDSEASDAIIQAVDRPDTRPVWVCVWGGPADLAQAIWKVRQKRSPAELGRFLSKLRVYMIGLGNKPGQDDSGQWMLDHFPDLFVIISQKTYGGMFAQHSPIGNLVWLDANVRQGHGPLGAVYPRSGINPNLPGQQEGDTPSFLYLYSAVRGMNDPDRPDQESWGGQYVQRDPGKRHWYDGPGSKSVSKWLPEIQADFARRADWMNGR